MPRIVLFLFSFLTLSGIQLLRSATIDPDFLIVDYGVANLVEQLPDGRMALAHGANANLGFLLLHPDGARDVNFKAPLAGEEITEVAMDREGRLLVFGLTLSVEVGETVFENMVRLLPNGELDEGFRVDRFRAPFSNPEMRIRPLEDGRILVTGRQSVFVLEENGSIDESFDSTPQVPTIKNMAVDF